MDSILKGLIPLLDRLYRMDKVHILPYQEMFGAIHAITGLALLTGSAAEGCALPRLLATGIFECDVMVLNKLKCNEVVEDVPGNHGYVYLKCEGPNGNQTFISPYKERTKVPPSTLLGIQHIYSGCLTSLFPEAFPYHNVHTAATSTNASLQYDTTVITGAVNTGFDVGRFSGDLVESKIIQTWPKVAKDWINRSRKWPSHDEVLRIADMGCHIVPKTSPTGDIHEEWRYSFSLSEIELGKLQTITQRENYLFLKLIFYGYIKPDIERDGEDTHERESGQPATSVTIDSDLENSALINQKRTLHSYSLKTAWLWFCEQHPPDDHIWKHENIPMLMRTFLKSYNAFLAKAFIPNYFIPEQNIIDGVPRDKLDISRDMIEHILSNLMEILIKILDGFCFLTDEYVDQQKDKTKSYMQRVFALTNAILQPPIGDPEPPIGDPDVDD